MVTDIRDLLVHLSVRELVVRSNSSNGQPPFSREVGEQQLRTNPTGHLQGDADLPRRDTWPVCEQLGVVCPGRVPN